jgi:hypothetical protein
MIDSHRAYIRTRIVLKGQRFADIPNIQSNVTTLLRGIPENDFREIVSGSDTIVSRSA